MHILALYFYYSNMVNPRYCSPASDLIQRSSSGGSLAPSEMASMSPPPAYSPGARDDTEVLSRRTAPNRGGAQDTVREAPQGETSTVGHMVEPIPMETGEEGCIQFDP